MCKECGKVMKPHCMFFDECYSEKYYRRDTVNSYLDEADCLIVVGTALQTGFAIKIVNEMIKKDAPIIEVNLESAIDNGLVLRVIAKSEVALP